MESNNLYKVEKRLFWSIVGLVVILFIHQFLIFVSMAHIKNAQIKIQAMDEKLTTVDTKIDNCGKGYGELKYNTNEADKQMQADIQNLYGILGIIP